MPDIKTANGLNIHFQQSGALNGVPLLLIMGLGSQLTVWPQSLIQHLMNKGYRVIRFDNRDVGYSSRLAESGKPQLMLNLLRKGFRRPLKSPYQLEDMAQDSVELMNSLGISSAHIVGVSMGGMIAQIIAAQFPDRCRSLISIMSTSSHTRVNRSNWWLLARLFRQRTHLNHPQHAQKANAHLNHLLGSNNKYAFSEEEIKQLTENTVMRAHDPQGYKRQLLAVTGARCRHPLLNEITAPTLIIHGSDDPLIPVEAGIDTAAHIKGARVKIIKGMGHALPPILGAKVGKLIHKHVRKTEKRRTPSDPECYLRNPRTACARSTA